MVECWTCSVFTGRHAYIKYHLSPLLSDGIIDSSFLTCCPRSMWASASASVSKVNTHPVSLQEKISVLGLVLSKTVPRSFIQGLLSAQCPLVSRNFARHMQDSARVKRYRPSKCEFRLPQTGNCQLGLSQVFCYHCQSHWWHQPLPLPPYSPLGRHEILMPVSFLCGYYIMSFIHRPPNVCFNGCGFPLTDIFPSRSAMAARLPFLPSPEG